MGRLASRLHVLGIMGSGAEKGVNTIKMGRLVSLL